MREAIAGHYRLRHQVAIDPGRIAVTTGSSAAFNLAFLTLFDAGDHVAIARPGYPAYRNILKALGLNVVEVPVTAETGYTLTPASLERAETRAGCKLKGVLLASPANPTGTVTGREALKRLASYCESRDMAFISDEIYHGLTFVGEETSALEITDNAVIINSFSKYYCMTGWRIGWMVLPENLVRPVECLAQSLYISPPELSQLAATAAFSAAEELDVYRESYRTNRDFLMARLPEIGLPLASPMDGAFTPMSIQAASPTTAWISPSACWRKSMWRRRQAWISIPKKAIARCAFPMRVPCLTLPRPLDVLPAG